MSGPHDVPGEHGADGTHADPDVGSVAEEAAKLFGALAGFAREHAPDLSEALAAHAGGPGRDEDPHGSGGEHRAGPSAECTWCPVCRTVHLVRQTSPEVRAHLASAVGSLARAAAGLLATAVPPEARPAPRPGVEHINLDEGDTDTDTDIDTDTDTDLDIDLDENHDGGPR